MVSGALGAATVLARWGVRGGGLLMLAAALLVSFDVIMRRVFNATTGGADELSGYAFAIGSAWSFAFVTLARMNVRVDALYMHLPRPLAGIMDFLSLVALAFPSFSDGRSFSKAELLRSRHRFEGSVRATGQVLVDQLPHMLRLGFDEFEVSHPVLIARLEKGEVGGIALHYQPTAMPSTKPGKYSWRRVRSS